MSKKALFVVYQDGILGTTKCLCGCAGKLVKYYVSTYDEYMPDEFRKEVNKHRKGKTPSEQRAKPRGQVVPKGTR